MISIIIPTFNAPALLLRAINSVLNQTCSGWEILICPDDGRDYYYLSEMDPRIRIVSSPLTASGPGPSRNRGLACARGDAIAYLDDDDRLSDNYVEESLLALKTRSAIVFPTTYVDEVGNIVRTIGASEDRLNIQQFSLELGSLHVVARADCFPFWHDYFAEDVIHTCEVIDKLDGSVDVIHSAQYIATIRKGSICATSLTIDEQYQAHIKSSMQFLSKHGAREINNLFRFRKFINKIYEADSKHADYNNFVKNIDLIKRKKLYDDAMLCNL